MPASSAAGPRRSRAGDLAETAYEGKYAADMNLETGKMAGGHEV
jgi:hypothetical protein